MHAPHQPVHHRQFPLPHPADLAARKALAARPPAPLERVLAGIFRYVSQKAGGQPLEEFIRLQALLVKQADGWKILMEYQIGPATKAEWDALPAPAGP